MNRTAWLLQADRGSLDSEDERFVAQLLTQVPILSKTAALANRLTRLLRRKSVESVETWFDDVRGTPLANFAAGLQRDADAVRHATILPWSTSPVEGQISRLKMIKRHMYGRAGFELLRQRVLHAA